MECSIPPAGSISKAFVLSVKKIWPHTECSPLTGVISWSEQNGTRPHDFVPAVGSDEFTISLDTGPCELRLNLNRQPYWDDSRRFGVSLFGQIFSDDRRGTAENPARGLLTQYERVGLKAFASLNGWFSGVLIDIPESRVVLFNDRFGLERMYYNERPGQFSFSSRAKSLLQAEPSLRTLNMEAVGELLNCGCTLSGKTFFQGLSILPGASLWVFTSEKCSKGSYFAPQDWEAQSLLDESSFTSALADTFRNLVQRYLRDDRSVAMSLTGGLDGRMIMASVHKKLSIPCYTFVGKYRHCADAIIAKEVAQACEQKHELIRVGDEFLSEFPALARQTVELSDGTMDITGAVELYVNRIARRIAPIRLTGNYGSEIVRGHVAFRPSNLISGIWNDELKPIIQRATSTYTNEANTHPLSFIAFKQVPWFHYSRFSIERSQLIPRSPFLDNDLVKLMYQAPPAVWQSREPSLRLIAEGNPKLAQIPTDRGLVYKPRPVLTRARNLFQEFTARAEYAYDYGMPNWLVRLDSLAAPLHLEKMFLGRHKFYHFRTWYRHELAPYVKETLLDKRSLARPYLRRKQVEKIVLDHTSGRGNYTTEIHQLLSLELIHRQLLERN